MKKIFAGLSQLYLHAREFQLGWHLGTRQVYASSWCDCVEGYWLSSCTVHSSVQMTSLNPVSASWMYSAAQSNLLTLFAARIIRQYELPLNAIRMCIIAISLHIWIFKRLCVRIYWMSIPGIVCSRELFEMTASSPWTSTYHAIGMQRFHHPVSSGPPLFLIRRDLS